MRSTLFIASMILGGAIAVSCSPAYAKEQTWLDRAICFGNGTCGVQGSAPTAGTAYPSQQSVLNPNLPTTVQVGSGSVLIVPNYSGGSLPRAIIPVSR
jgi:hypothetical protein